MIALGLAIPETFLTHADDMIEQGRSISCFAP
jgi:hypothetical protein